MLSKELEHCLNEAFHQARQARHEHLTVEHLLLAILDTPRVGEILGALSADLGRLKQELTDHIDQSTPRLKEGEEREVQATLGFQRVLQRAVFHVQSSGKKEVGTANVLVAIFSEKQSHSVLLLSRQHVTRHDVVNYITHGLVTGAANTAAQSGEPGDLEEATQAVLQGSPFKSSTQDDPEIMRLIEAVLIRAVQTQASDVHIEPFAGRLTIRFRVEGVLREVLQHDPVLAPRLASGIKRLAGLDSARTLPQEARITVKIAGGLLDLTVATLPSRQGERVVLHLEPAYRSFAALGMEARTVQQLEALLLKPGLLVVTGPPGSGRTTALYTALARFDERLLNIMTVEDRIGRNIDGISQTPVGTQITSARALDALLRQDPDVVMIDAVQDGETARLAVAASQAKRVLASLESNTAAGAIIRLLGLGVEPAQLSLGLSGVLALRRVRRLDPAARETFEAGEAERAFLGLNPEDPLTLLYRPVGDAGYRGWTGIHELLVADEALRAMIREGASEQELERQARQSTASLRDAALAKVLSGETTLEEASRVLGEG